MKALMTFRFWIISFESPRAEILKASVSCIRSARQGWGGWWAAAVQTETLDHVSVGPPAPLRHGHSRAALSPAERSSPVPTLYDQTLPGARERRQQWRPKAGLISAVSTGSL